MILTYIESREKKVKKSSLEALSEARRKAAEFGITAAAVLIGTGMEALAAELPSFGASKVYLLENASLDRYSTQDHAAALAGLVKKLNPKAVFFSATAMGKDLAPRLAARLGVGLASDCTRVSVRDGGFEYTRPIFAGKALLTFRLTSSPEVVSLRPNVFPLAPAAGAGEVIREAVEIPAAQARAEVTEVLQESGGEIDVTEADIVISGGRGMKGPENFELLREISALIPRSTVGASRSAVDSGWIGHQHQVGQTGKTVSPNLYLAFGISGAIQHIAGMSSSKVIVAVNKDPDAPIFKVADFGVVGDLFQVIPPLKEELKKLRG
ncbi:MAG TPA: electron transfer flavoprotein subunit alpha [Candidatus Aminicenantes bacterium]|nr:electron transfer flavoprotein subunit alpha [Candidatus Aminicenantes bacterium]